MRKTKLPGVWELRDGGYYVRGRWKAQSGETKEIQKALPHAADADEARQELRRLVAEARLPQSLEAGTTPLFSEYAASALESRIRSKRIKSRASVAKWQDALELHVLPVFGHRAINEIKHRDLLDWLKLLEQKIHSKEYGARTVNTWIRIVKSIFKVGAPYFGFTNPAVGIMQFPEVERTHTAESPNALPPQVVASFMARLKKKYPQHFAMAVLMLATGLRPSSCGAAGLRRTTAQVRDVFTSGDLRCLVSPWTAPRRAGTRRSTSLPCFGRSLMSTLPSLMRAMDR